MLSGAMLHLVPLLAACASEPPPEPAVALLEAPSPAPAESAPPEEEPPSPEPPALPDRSPAVGTFISMNQGSLDHFFAALERVEAGEPGSIARILSWGDSTIAGDGIVSTVRERLQEELGDGGPGFLTAHVDPHHAYRHGVAQWTEGEWESLSITFGGAETPRYGLAGIVSTATGEARSLLGGREIDGERQLLNRFDLYFQYQPGGGSFTTGGPPISTDAAAVSDGFIEVRSDAGARFLSIETLGDGPVTFYGAALETAGPGVTWETFGVAGSGVGSMGRQLGSHLKGQIARRDPALIVYWTGANEWGYESVTEDDGVVYQEVYEGVVRQLWSAADNASCLLIGPLDQASQGGGEIVSEPALERIIEVQSRAAHHMGCAWWDARAAMGGDGSFKRWLEADPPLAKPDRLHLTDEGKALIGHALADALLYEYRAR
jgi:hypothetical protein